VALVDVAGAVLLVQRLDRDPARDQPVIELVELGHALADLGLDGFGGLDIVERDLERLLHASLR